MRHRPIAAIDADIEAASTEVARARDDFMDLPSNLARLVAPLSARVAAGIAAERTAWTEAEARLQALLEEREAALEELAVRALEREAAGLPNRPPPPAEPIEPLREAVGNAGQLIAALEAASEQLVFFSPQGDRLVQVTTTPPPEDWGRDRVGELRRGLEEAAAMREALVTFDARLACPAVPASPVPAYPHMVGHPTLHHVGVEVRAARDAYLAIAAALTARLAAAERARRLQAAWERTHGG